MNVVCLPMDVEFSIHAAALAIQNLNRDELEEAFVELLHQKAVDRQMFLSILKEHGIDADINFNLSTIGQVS
jgi:hypothetical protein